MLRIIFAILFLPCLALAATIHVPGDFSTIQQAISNCNPHDTVFVAAGTYTEHVVIDKPLTLSGIGYETVIDGGGIGSVILASADSVHISQLSVLNGGTDRPEDLPYDSGIKLLRCRFASVEQCYIHHNGATGVTLAGCSLTVVYANYIADNPYGISFTDGSIFNGLIPDTVYWNVENSVEDNIVWRNSVAVLFPYTYDAPNVRSRIVGNTIAVNGLGITLWNAQETHILRNQFERNSFKAIDYWLIRGEFQTFAENNFIDNNLGRWPGQVYEVATGWSNWYDSTTNRGNYWSDYVGLDGDGDGCGDTPYEIPYYNSDPFPLMSPMPYDCCSGPIRGNMDGDPMDELSISDVTHLVGYMFKDGRGPRCLDEADTNGSTTIDIADLTALVGYMFRAGPSPATCN